jgi:hypothetical protein
MNDLSGLGHASRPMADGTKRARAVSRTTSALADGRDPETSRRCQHAPHTPRPTKLNTGALHPNYKHNLKNSKTGRLTESTTALLKHQLYQGMRTRIVRTSSIIISNPANVITPTLIITSLVPPDTSSVLPFFEGFLPRETTTTWTYPYTLPFWYSRHFIFLADNIFQTFSPFQFSPYFKVLQNFLSIECSKPNNNNLIKALFFSRL